nr:PREDICTED: uncharacterized protein LOC103547181 [Equus przewalskii]
MGASESIWEADQLRDGFYFGEEGQSKGNVSQGLQPRIPETCLRGTVTGQFPRHLAVRGGRGFRPVRPGCGRRRRARAQGWPSKPREPARHRRGADGAGALARHRCRRAPALRQPQPPPCAPCAPSPSLPPGLVTERGVSPAPQRPQVQPADKAGRRLTSGFCYKVTRSASAQAGSWGCRGLLGRAWEGKLNLRLLGLFHSLFPYPHPLRCQNPAESRRPTARQAGGKRRGRGGPRRPARCGPSHVRRGRGRDRVLAALSPPKRRLQPSPFGDRLLHGSSPAIGRRGPRLPTKEKKPTEGGAVLL